MTYDDTDNRSNAKYKQKPTDKCYQDALKTKSTSYLRIGRSLAQMKGCLESGYPFVIGFSVYDSFYNDEVTHRYIFSIAICIIFIFKPLKNMISSLILVISYLKYNKKNGKRT